MNRKPNPSRPVSLHGSAFRGTQPKWKEQELFFKADHLGYEALSEVVVSRFLRHSGVKDFVVYEPVRILSGDRPVTACVCRNFRKENEILVSFEQLHRAFRGRGLAELLQLQDEAERILYVADFMEETCGLSEAGRRLTEILEIDSFFLNTDRRTTSLRVLRNEDTLKYRPCPVHGNGHALLSDLTADPPGSDIRQCIAKANTGPYGSDFYSILSKVRNIFGPQLRFSFGDQDPENVFQGLEEYYPAEIIERAKTVLRIQIDNHPEYFA